MHVYNIYFKKLVGKAYEFNDFLKIQDVLCTCTNPTQGM